MSHGGLDLAQPQNYLHKFNLDSNLIIVQLLPTPEESQVHQGTCAGLSLIVQKLGKKPIGCLIFQRTTPSSVQG